MVLDTSALLAVLFDEPDAERFRVAIEQDETRLVSAGTLLETTIVVEARTGEAGGRELELLLHKAAITTVAVDGDQVAEARRAWRRFGKGRHAANLNYGDLFAYALSRTVGEPLLFKGDDFAHTDIKPAVLSGS